MNNFLFVFVLYKIFSRVTSQCDVECEYSEYGSVCGYSSQTGSYTLFPSECAMEGYAKCHNIDILDTDLKYCMKQDFPATRRDYDESCPVFCPNHYSPVCGQSEYKRFVYRTFINRCHLDMLNCRGADEFSSFVEVPLKFCPRHAMKNLFKEKVIVSDVYDSYRDYFRK